MPFGGVDAGTAILDIKPDYDGVSRSVSSEGKSLFGGFGKSMAAAFAGAFVVDKAADLFKGAISNASDLSEQLGKNSVVFGKFSKSVFDFSDGSAAAFGVSKRAALEATGTFGNLFRAIGLGQDVSADMSVNLVKLAADLASFNNATPEEALEALRAGLTGETEPLKKFGINLNEATLKAKAMQLGLSDGKGVLSASAKAQASYALILEQSTLAQGDFTRTSGGLANQQRILSARWEDLQAKIGTAFLPVAVKTVTFLTSSAIPAIEDLAALIGGKAKEVWGEWGGDIVRWLTTVEDGFKSFWYTLTTGFTENEGTPLESVALAVRDVAGVLGDVLMPIARTVGGFLADNLQPILIGVGGAFAALAGSSAIGAVIGGLTAVATVLASPIVLLGVFAAGLVFAYQKSETFRDIVSGAFGVAGDAISAATDIVKGIGGALVDAGSAVANSGLRDKLVDVGDKSRDAFRGAMGAVDDLAGHVESAATRVKGSQLGESISGAGLPDPGGSSSFWSRTGQAIFNVIGDLRTLGESAGTFGSIFQAGLSGPLEAVGSKVTEVFSGLKTDVEGAGSNLLGFAGTYGAPFLESWRKVWDDVGVIYRFQFDAFKIAWNDLFSDQTLIDLAGDLATRAMESVRAAFDIGTQQVRLLWAVNWGGILETARNFGGRMVSQVSSDVSGVIDWFAGMPGRILGVLVNMKSLLPQKGQDIISGLQAGASIGFNMARGWFAGLGGMIFGAVGPLGNALYDKGVQIIQGLINGIKDKAKEIPGVVSGAVKGAVGLSPGGFLGGKLGIPGFAVGGIIDRPMIAQLHSNEVVIPLSKPARAMELAQKSGLLDLLGTMPDYGIGGGTPPAGGQGITNNFNAPISIGSEDVVAELDWFSKVRMAGV